MAFLELRSPIDMGIILDMYENCETISNSIEKSNIKFSQELNVTYDTEKLVNINVLDCIQGDLRYPNELSRAISKGILGIHDCKTFHQYTDIWGAEPKYVTKVDLLAGKMEWISAAKYYRLAFRDIAGSGDKRTAIFSLIPPGFICTNKAPSERKPFNRPNSNAIKALSIFNSFTFDYYIRLRVRVHVGLYILRSIPVPWSREKIDNFLIHSALRLLCNHNGYKKLWQEQLGSTWREPNKKPLIWPVLETEEERWNVRSAIDAVIADAYGLDREQYEHILKSFDRASGPNPYTEICLEKYDELKKIGLEKYTRKYDPYWDIPLNEELPKPVIEIPLPKEEETQQNMF